MVKEITRQKIKRALLVQMVSTPLENIKISDVIALSGAGRTTFYRIYSGLDEVLAEIRADMGQQLKAHMLPIDYRQLTVHMATYYIPIFYDQRDVLRILFQDAQWETYVRNIFVEWLQEQINESGNKSVSNFRGVEHYVITLLIDAHISLLRTWVMQPIIEPPQVFMPNFIKIMRHTLNDIS